MLDLDLSLAPAPDPLVAVYPHPLHGRLVARVVHGVQRYFIHQAEGWYADYVLVWRWDEELYYQR